MLVNCLIANNSAGLFGGAFFGYGYGSGTYPVLINCIIVENSAWTAGGLYLSDECSPSLTNCIIAGNVATHTGGGVYCTSSSPVVDNCTITGNTAENGGGIACHSNWMITPAEPVLTNCVIWANTPDAIYNHPYDPGYPVFTYCDIEGGGWFGTGNIDADPVFRSRAGFDYLLAPGSPCIDVGDPTIEDGISVVDYRLFASGGGERRKEGGRGRDSWPRHRAFRENLPGCRGGHGRCWNDRGPSRLFFSSRSSAVRVRI